MSLLGPNAQLWSGKYDRAMVGFLACLREFGQAALAEDAAAGRVAGDAFVFPFPLEADKVGGGGTLYSPVG